MQRDADPAPARERVDVRVEWAEQVPVASVRYVADGRVLVVRRADGEGDVYQSVFLPRCELAVSASGELSGLDLDYARDSDLWRIETQRVGRTPPRRGVIKVREGLTAAKEFSVPVVLTTDESGRLVDLTFGEAGPYTTVELWQGWLNRPGFLGGSIVWIREDGVMPREITPGKPGTRRYSPEEKQQAVRLVRQLAVELGTSHGTVQRVARQLGYGVESVRLWVRQADVDDGVTGGVSTQDAARVRELEVRVRELERANEILRRASVFFAAELDRRQR